MIPFEQTAFNKTGAGAFCVTYEMVRASKYTRVFIVDPYVYPWMQICQAHEGDIKMLCLSRHAKACS